MGYDSIVGINLCYVAAALGFAGAILNPFTIGIAQGLSDLPLFQVLNIAFLLDNNQHYRHWMAVTLCSESIENPKLSPVYEDDAYWRENTVVAEDQGIIKTKNLPGLHFNYSNSINTLFNFLSYDYPKGGKFGNDITRYPNNYNTLFNFQYFIF